MKYDNQISPMPKGKVKKGKGKALPAFMKAMKKPNSNKKGK